MTNCGGYDDISVINVEALEAASLRMLSHMMGDGAEMSILRFSLNQILFGIERLTPLAPM